MDHRKPGEPMFSDQRSVPMLLWGIDFTDTAAVLAKRLRLMQDGHFDDDPEFDALHATAYEAIRRGIRPRR